MPIFPYGPRPVSRQIQYTRREPPRAEKNDTAPQAENDILKNAAFTPELSFLLAMTLKDGLRQGTVLDLLKSIEPYVCARDRDAIHQILKAQKIAEEYRANPPEIPHGFPGADLYGFSRMSRQQALLEILQHYASRESSELMRALQRSVQMQENFARLVRRLEKLRRMNMTSPEEMFEAISMFMPPEQQSQLKNIQNMMRMMAAMQGMKPEDIFKFMNSSR
ncbi:MAG: hypothetical protein GXW96_10635 [Christensenellaceae bacterium]|nr:hypothetical protein [Christensenellaceae bacterium]